MYMRSACFCYPNARGKGSDPFSSPAQHLQLPVPGSVPHACPKLNAFLQNESEHAQPCLALGHVPEEEVRLTGG